MASSCIIFTNPLTLMSSRKGLAFKFQGKVEAGLFSVKWADFYVRTQTHRGWIKRKKLQLPTSSQCTKAQSCSVLAHLRQSRRAGRGGGGGALSLKDYCLLFLICADEIQPPSSGWLHRGNGVKGDARQAMNCWLPYQRGDSFFFQQKVPGGQGQQRWPGVPLVALAVSNIALDALQRASLQDQLGQPGSYQE